MPLQKLQFRPGMNREGTNYSNEGGWYDGDKVRFRSGFPEKIGGWTQVSPDQFIGICRSLWVWQDADSGAGNDYIGVGTSAKYYIYFAGAYNNITPIYETSVRNNPFTTTLGSRTITVTDPSVSPSEGDWIQISNSVVVAGLELNGNYQVSAITGATTYTFEAPSPASSAVTGGGTGVVIEYEYPAGNNVFTTGTGWGAGPWGGPPPVPTNLGSNPFAATNGFPTITVTQAAHGYSTGNYVTFSGATAFAGFTTGQLNDTYQISVVSVNTYTITLSTTATSTASGGGASVIANLQPHGWGTEFLVGLGQQLRLWSNSNFGSDLVLAPRGGPVFYWTDIGTVSERAKYLSDIADDTVSFSDAATFGNGATNITITIAATALVYPYMFITGTNIPPNTQVAPSYNLGSTTVPITNATTGASSGLYDFSFAGAYVPKSTYQVLSSSIQRFVICMGANSYDPSNPNNEFNPMLVRWSDQENPYQWISEANNQSGEFPLTNGSFIMAARTTRQEILVWTDSCLYSMQYLGPPFVWGFQVLMDNISVISPNSMITASNVTYWMGRDRFYMYSGRVEVLPCALRQYVFGDLNQEQAYQITCGSNEAYNEVWWFYVSNSSNGNIVDKYVIYNYLDRVWYYGTLNRTAWLQAGTLQYPIAADYNGRLLFHENGCDDQSTDVTLPIYSYIQSSDFDISDGHNFGFVWRMLPDINFNNSRSNQPQVTLTVRPRVNSGTPYGSSDNTQVRSAQNYITAPQYTIQEFTGQVYTRLRGRQLAFRIESNEIGVAWQLGSPRIDIRPDGRR
jgi:hypothetical protein